MAIYIYNYGLNQNCIVNTCEIFTIIFEEKQYDG